VLEAIKQLNSALHLAAQAGVQTDQAVAAHKMQIEQQQAKGGSWSTQRRCASAADRESSC
jgi:hypothetical protein